MKDPRILDRVDQDLDAAIDRLKDLLRIPSISTMHIRQPPNGDRSLCEQSEGT